MPERLKAILDKITAWWKKFNTKQRSVLISIVAVVIVALVILGVVISRPTQVELVEAQSASEASTIKGVLEDNNISYEVDSNMVEAKNISGTVADEYNSEKTDSSATNSDASSQKAETEQDSQMQDSQTAQEDTQQEAAQPATDAKQETVEPQDAVTTYTISVTSQDTCRTIAEKLKALNLVDDAEQFRIYMGQKGADHFIADGEHIIPQGASYDDIITILTQK